MSDGAAKCWCLISLIWKASFWKKICSRCRKPRFFMQYFIVDLVSRCRIDSCVYGTMKAGRKSEIIMRVRWYLRAIGAQWMSVWWCVNKKATCLCVVKKRMLIFSDVILLSAFLKKLWQRLAAIIPNFFLVRWDSGWYCIYRWRCSGNIRKCRRWRILLWPICKSKNGFPF